MADRMTQTELLDQAIQELDSMDQVKAVLHYLVILNPQAVQNALQYVKRQRKDEQQQDDTTLEAPPPLGKARSVEDDSNPPARRPTPASPMPRRMSLDAKIAQYQANIASPTTTTTAPPPIVMKTAKTSNQSPNNKYFVPQPKVYDDDDENNVDDKDDSTTQPPNSNNNTWSLKDSVTLKPVGDRTSSSSSSSSPKKAAKEVVTLKSVSKDQSAPRSMSQEPENDEEDDSQFKMLSKAHHSTSFIEQPNSPRKATSTTTTTSNGVDSPSTNNSSSTPSWMQMAAQKQKQQESSPALPTKSSAQEVAPKTDTSLSPKQESPPPSVEEPSRKSALAKFPVGGACYLVYDPVQGQLVIYYSEWPMDGAVGVWTSPDMAAFQQAQGLSSNEWIGTCATGVTQDRKQYYKGWCQFVKAARNMDATVTVLADVGLPVDFYLYIAGINIQAGASFETADVDAVACLPKNSSFYGNAPLDGKKFKKKAKKAGGAIAELGTSSLSQWTAATEPLAYAQGGDAATTSTDDEDLEDDDEEEDDDVVAPLPSEMSFSNLGNSSLSNGLAAAASNYDGKQQATSANMQPASSSSMSVGDSSQSSFGTSPEDMLSSPIDSAANAVIPSSGACFLVYEPDSSGRLVEHYSKAAIPGAIGLWLPGGKKKISGFKFSQNLGKTVLIGNCSAGVQGRKNYCSGWCQFVRSARLLEASVVLWDPVSKGLAVDVWLYQDDNRPSHQSIQLERGVAVNVSKVLAVACLPKNTPFYANLTVDIGKWLADANSMGVGSKF